MFVILTYDVSHKRVSKVMKICRRYLHHVQNSVFEGMMTESMLGKLKRDLDGAFVPSEDSICIYEIQNIKYTRKESVGIQRREDNIF